MFISVSVYLCARVFECFCLFICVCVFIRVCVCACYVCMCVCLCAYMYAYTHLHTGNIKPPLKINFSEIAVMWHEKRATSFLNLLSLPSSYINHYSVI